MNCMKAFGFKFTIKFSDDSVSHSIRHSFKSGEYSEDDYYTWLLSDGVVKNAFSDFKGYPLPLEEKIENEKTRRGWGLYPSPVYDEDNNLILPLPEDEKPTE